MESLEVRSLLAGDTVNPDSLDTILSSPEETTEETALTAVAGVVLPASL